MKYTQAAIVSVAFFLFTAPNAVFADEVWNSNYGKVVYQSDRGKTAIWTYPTGAIFIEGLAGVWSNRGIYHGYWVGKSDVKCDTGREDASGNFMSWYKSLACSFLGE